MDMSKRVAVAMSGLVFAGAAALAIGTANPAGAAAKIAAPQGDHCCWVKKKDHKKKGDNGGGGGGGGGSNFYNPYQPHQPELFIDDL